MDVGALYRAIVEESPDGIWVYDLDGRTVYANGHVASMFRVPEEELLGLRIFDFLDDVGRSQFQEHLDEIGRDEPIAADVQCRFVRRDGTTFWVLVHESLMRDPDGALLGVLTRINDYSERRMTVDELRAERRRLAEAQRMARIGSWTWDVVRDELMPSAELVALYGLDRGSFPVGFGQFLDQVHPEDRSRVQDALDAVTDGGNRFVFTARIRGPRGWLWTRGRGEARRDEAGTVVSMSGTHQDITEAKQAELALIDTLQQNAVLQAVATAANEAATLREALGEARSLVLRHDDLVRGRAFVPTPDGTAVTPLYIEESDWTADVLDPSEAAIEQEVATSAFRLRRPVWDRRRLTIAFPVRDQVDVHAVLTITAAPPLRRHEMVQSLVEQLGVQLGRVAERERSQRELASARDAAMEASRQKSDFLATMSHEIRTPLNGVIGLNELLLRTTLDTGQERLAAGVQVASKALLAVLNDILDFSKIEAGELVLEQVDFEVRPVFTQVVDVLGESARAKGVALVVECDDAVPVRLNGDPTKLGQVISNLVSNAVKFTERGRVDLRATARAGRVTGQVDLVVEVTDTGVGIDQTRTSGLFSPFTQADASTTRLYGGTGLGLAISKQIVDAFGGDLVYDPNPHGGSIFSFTAHLLLPTDAPGEVTREAPVNVVRPRLPDGRASHRVLVVEDNAINQMVATGLLESQGYDVEVAGDGMAALEVLRERAFDAVLMDVQMPRLDGYATTRSVRRNPGPNQRVPIIAMTAAAIEGERDRCLEAGMDDFLTKPVDPAALAQVMAEWIDTPPPDPADEESDPVTETPPPPAAPAPRAAAPSAAIAGLDVTRLDMLRDLDLDSTAYIDRAIGNFLANSAAAVTSMRESIDAGDVQALRYTSHKLVGSALNLGVVEAGEAVRLIEHIADSGSVEGAADLLPQVELALEHGRGSLRDYQANYQVAQPS